MGVVYTCIVLLLDLTNQESFSLVICILNELQFGIRSPNPTHAPIPINNAAAGTHTKLKTNSGNLISRYGLQERITDSTSASTIVATPEEAGGKAVWETSAEKREASLRERKAQMILAARQCVAFRLIRCSLSSSMVIRRLMKREVATAGSSKDV